MSQFIKKLNTASEGSPQPVGFRTAAPRELPRIIIAAEISKEFNNIKNLAADGIILNPVPARPEKLPSPWGIRLTGEETNLREAIENGCDFAIFPDKTSESIFQENTLGRILILDALAESSYLRATSETPINAVLLNFEESPIKKLTWRHMILLKRVTSLTNKPLIVPVDIKISAKDIADLWMANVSGIVVQIASQEDISKLADLNKLIGEINLPPRRKELSPRVTLPQQNYPEEEEPEEHR